MKINFKKLLLVFFVFLFTFLSSSFVLASTEKPELVSKSAILMDRKTKKILYAKNENEKMYPASTTKIMTAILTLEHCNLDDFVMVSYNTVMSIPEGYASAFLQVGEQLKVEQLLELLLVHSANDAANALAEYVGGSIPSFVSMMNTKAHELGLSNTNFTNSFGMHDENHYTTACDLATLMNYCVQNKNFRKLAGKASCAIPATNQYDVRKYNSTNDLIIPDNPNYYPFLTCGKTGYTKQAGDCLVSCAYKNNLELICVILGGKTVDNVSTRFSETKTLYEYGYNNYSIQPLWNENDKIAQIEVSNASKDTKNLDLLATSTTHALLDNSFPKDTLHFNVDLKDDIKAPLAQGEILGSVSYELDGITYKTNLMASHSVEKSKLLFYLIGIGIVVLILILLLIYFVFFHKKEKNYDEY